MATAKVQDRVLTDEELLELIGESESENETELLGGHRNTKLT